MENPSPKKRNLYRDFNQNALKHFIALENKLRRDPRFKISYIESFNEYRNARIIEEIPENELDKKSVFYLPHSGVVKRSLEPSKVRIVFDGSAKSTNGRSLNDNLMMGPNLQNELFDILVRFRTHQVVISCDMEKIFLQIKIDDKNKDFQRLFFRNSENEPIKQYRVTRLVMRCVRKIAEEIQEQKPEASRVLRHDIFMYDILCGADNIEEAIKLRSQLRDALHQRGFKLSKWISNDPRVLCGHPFPERQSVPLDFEKAETVKILGLWWNSTLDTFSYRLQKPSISEKLTKRLMLSSIVKLFDPIRVIGPIVIKAKNLMRTLWIYIQAGMG